MPILRLASFDNVNDAGLSDILLEVGDLRPGIQSPGRFGFGQYVGVGNNGPCRFAFNHVGQGISGTPRVIFGFAYNQTSAGNSGLPYGGGNVVLRDASGVAIGSLQTTTDGSVGWNVQNGPTIAVSSRNQLYTPGVWCYIEIDIEFAGSGSINMYVNGALVSSATGVQTEPGSGGGDITSCSIFEFQASYFDDIYIYDATGETTPAAPFGNVAIAGLLATGAGRVAQWTPSPSSNQNWQNISENGPDGDTTYNSASEAGLTDAYEIAALPLINGHTPTAVLAVQATAIVRTDSAGSRVVSVGVGNGATESFDAGESPGSTYFTQYRLFASNPFTDEPWTVADMETLQAAIKVIS